MKYNVGHWGQCEGLLGHGVKYSVWDSWVSRRDNADREAQKSRLVVVGLFVGRGWSWDVNRLVVLKQHSGLVGGC